MLLIVVVIVIQNREWKSMVRVVSAISAGKEDWKKPRIHSSEMQIMWNSLSELVKNTAKSNYEKYRTLRAYYRFAPKQVERILGCTSVAEVAIGDYANINGIMVLAQTEDISVESRIEFMQALKQNLRIVKTAVLSQRLLLITEQQSGDVRASGFVSSPAAGHGTRARQLFFVNGRLVKSQLLTAAVEEAYRNRLLKGKFPGCVLHITLPVNEVDVNVHPAKTVVKFAAEKAVFDAVHYTVKDALDGEGRPKAAEKPFYQTMTAQEFLKRPDAPKPSQAAMLPMGKTIGSAPARPAATEPVRPAPAPAPVTPVMAVHDVVCQPDKPFAAPAAPGVVYHITPPEVRTPAEETAERPETTPSPAPAAEPEQQELAMPEGPAAAEQPWRVAGEVLKTYIICEDAERNVWLIDKHAAHERMRFDALKARTEPPMRQLLLTPAAVTLAAEEYTAVLENLELLADCGFLCEDFGDGTVLVREVPDDVRAEDAAATLEELAQKLRLHSADRAALRDEVLHTVASRIR